MSKLEFASFAQVQPIAVTTMAVPSMAQSQMPAPSTDVPAVPSADELQLDIITRLDQIQAIAPQWNALFARAGRAGHVFQTWSVIELFVRTQGYASGMHPCGCEIAVVTATRGDKLVLVWPMAVQHKLGARLLFWLGEPISQYGDVLVDPEEPTADALQVAYDYAVEVLKPDVIRLRKVRADATIAPFLAKLGIAPQEAVEAPCITLAAGGSAVDSRQSGKARKNRRRLYRRLEERGTVTFAEVSGSALEEAVAAGLADKRQWLTSRGLVSPALADPHFDTFVLKSADAARGQSGGAVFALSLDGRPIAFAWGLRCRNRLMLHMIAYAADMEKSGAGVLNLEAILQHAEAEGLEAVDMLPPKVDYKLDWADTTVAVADHVWGVTTRGRIWTNVFYNFARVQARNVLGFVPVALRRRLTKRTLRSVRPATTCARSNA